MPTFIDESGSTSYHPGSTSYHPDSQPYFRLCAVWVPPDRADELRAGLASVRAALGLPAGYEFKYHKTQHRPERLRAFFGVALACGVRFASACIDKTREPWVGRGPLDFFYGTAMPLACSLRATYCEELARAGRLRRDPVAVDDNSDRAYLDCVRHAFRGVHSPQQPGVPLAQKPRFANFRTAELLQLPDMIGGAVGDLLDGRPEWYELVAAAGVRGTHAHRPGVICWGELP